MKKLLVILLALAVMAPAIGYACDCCPSSYSQPAGPQLESATRRCCPTLDLQKDVCGIQEQSKIALTLQNVFIPQASLGSISNFIPSVTKFDFPRTGPPSFLNHVPLYLAHQVLRF